MAVHNTVISFNKLTKNIKIIQDGKVTRDYESHYNGLDDASNTIRSVLSAANIHFSISVHENTVSKSLTFEYV